MFNVNPGGVICVVGTIDPATITGAEVFSDVVDMSIWDLLLATLLLGDIAASTIDLKVYKCDSNGANPSAALKSITQLAAHATNNDNKQAIMAWRANEMPSGGQYCKFGLTIGATGGPASLVVHGITNRYAPAGLASVVETVK